ncbi:hypothetical protein AGABI1DRAFT_115975 [Agaricus bisporus var. burnettii JB137-S8]|uniref:Uncharacterized protein n=1 Tax=Agaricus bisporus var. burnettii (strain JB137-S8 / ATCC MYA-4627 / FGSC 10392) TaxID=597362 RepID=K5VP40_AGABU|nr:uncharacterized protein AGABI1DRAFT_115975 [Agaricus bisporus var. burnettii JB137-S8]EKM76229.1 hypothetical protein AGABI1DRAFT_115975 [Agaricus bisporus var. burnettii JB137-S8]
MSPHRSIPIQSIIRPIKIHNEIFKELVFRNVKSDGCGNGTRVYETERKLSYGM